VRVTTEKPTTGANDRTGPRRMSVVEAAELLGITVAAVRGRIKRGTLETEREGERVWVLLPPDKATGHRPATDRAADQPTYEPDTLTSVKDETIAMLREQLEAERQAHAEARRLLLSALEKIPSAIEAPSETQGSPPAPEPEYERMVERERTRELQRQLTEVREQLKEERSKGFWARLFGG
jgi:hypothetical protein